MNSSPGMADSPAHIVVRRMRESDLDCAVAGFRLAFGTFMRLPDPGQFAAGRDFIGPRWRANAASALTAEIDGGFAGSNVATRWGSFGAFGPLTVRPEFWNHRVAQHLLAATMELFAEWDVTEHGLFTFSNSARHVHLYQKFGYWPRFLTAILSQTTGSRGPAAPIRYSELSEARRAEAIGACRALTDALHDGLDVTGEIQAVWEQRLGETLIIWDGEAPDGFAVCHCGENTEAGPGNCYVKFAAVRSGAGAERRLERLLDVCEHFAWERGLPRIEAGVNLARRLAYRALLDRGYRTEILGVAMQRPDTPGYNRPEVPVLDDWR